MLGHDTLLTNAFSQIQTSVLTAFSYMAYMMIGIYFIKSLPAIIPALFRLIYGILGLLKEILIGKDELYYPPDNLEGKTPKQPQENSKSKPAPERISLKMINDIEWFAFETLTLKYLTLAGFSASPTKLGADGGVDIVITKKNHSKAYVQCKAWGTHNVGVKSVREFYGVMTADGVSEGYFVTTGNFTRDAQKFASNKPIKLVSGHDLLRRIEGLSVEKQNQIYNSIFAGKDFKTPTCPKCCQKMVIRTPKAGGKMFWGCRSFPRCNQRLPLRQKCN